MAETTILTGAQVAALFGVHPSTVVNWAESGVLPCFRTPGGHRRYQLSDVETLRDSRRTGAAA